MPLELGIVRSGFLEAIINSIEGCGREILGFLFGFVVAWDAVGAGLHAGLRSDVAEIGEEFPFLSGHSRPARFRLKRRL